jgi:putative transcriptional regulator
MNLARTRADGTVVEVLEAGTERPFAGTAMRPMTEGEISATAAADPDARPMTDAEWQAARKVPRAKTLRRALRLTQEEFAARFQIPLGTPRDWEQGRVEPDQAKQAYLRAIAGDAAAVQHALETGPKAP